MVDSRQAWSPKSARSLRLSLVIAICAEKRAKMWEILRSGSWAVCRIAQIRPSGTVWRYVGRTRLVSGARPFQEHRQNNSRLSGPGYRFGRIAVSSSSRRICSASRSPTSSLCFSINSCCFALSALKISRWISSVRLRLKVARSRYREIASATTTISHSMSRIVKRSMERPHFAAGW